MAKDEIDEELMQGLRQARKKPRNFALIGKGTKPLHLIVQKKPVRSGELRKARAEYKGNLVIKGVCQGDGGSSLVLQVTGEEPNIKLPLLRELISEKTALNIKPRFQVMKEPAAERAPPAKRSAP